MAAVGLVYLLIIAFFYFIPSIAGHKKQNAGAIFALNLLVAAMGVQRTFELVKQTQQSAEKTEIDFVFLELAVGMTTCKIARSRRVLGLDVAKRGQHAELALSTANSR